MSFYKIALMILAFSWEHGLKMRKKRTYRKFFFCWDFGAGADIAIGIARVVVVHIDLRVVRVELQAWHIVIGIARAKITILLPYHRWCKKSATWVISLSARSLPGQRFPLLPAIILQAVPKKYC